MFKILNILIFLIIFYLIKNKNKKHKFWDKQPVSNKNIKNIGRISTNPYFNINLYDKYSFQFIKVNHATINFINTHFSDYNKYNYDYLYDTLNYIGSYNISLFLVDTLIGFIHAKPIKLFLDNKKINVFYVDFLCVHEKYRNKNLAAYLISFLINQCNSNQIFIFKKDNKKLPFNYLNKTQYYYNFIYNYKKKKIKNKIVLLDTTNIKETFEFINEIKKTYICSDYYSLDYFITNYYNNSAKQIYIEYDNNSIISVFVFVNNFFKFKKNKLKTLDIENIYINNSNLNITSLFNYLINYSLSKQIDIITCIDNMQNYYFIKKYNLSMSMDLFYHMYNYNYPLIENKNMSFNIL